MKRDLAEHRCCVEALSHTTYTIVLTSIINHRHIHTTHSHKCHQYNTIHSETSEYNPIYIPCTLTHLYSFTKYRHEHEETIVNVFANVKWY